MGVFFLFIHTRIQPYVDYGGVLVTHFFPSAVPPRYVKHPRAGSRGGSAFAPQTRAFPASTGYLVWGFRYDGWILLLFGFHLIHKWLSNIPMQRMDASTSYAASI